MKTPHRLSLLSPLDSRYYMANQELFDQISLFLSEDAALQYHLKVELALLSKLAEEYSLPKTLMQKARVGVQGIKGKDVIREEAKTKHHIRAVVHVIKKNVPKELRHLVHLGATSHDIIETGLSMRIKDLSSTVFLPLLLDILECLISLSQQNLRTVQVGRTHGQFAVPITLGHFFAEYVSRIGQSITCIQQQLGKIPGKLSGAVGAYNALALIVAKPLQFEKEFLQELDLPASEYSKQICSPEPMLRLLLEYNILFGIFANLADDLRNLQRSEISELTEFFSKKQVGSSTMPQKQNPWNSEHIKSLYKAFSPRVMTFFMDQISEHQRDLTNSASSRFIADYLSGFAAAAARCKKVLGNLTINHKSLEANLDKAGDSILSEAMYVLLSLENVDNAHEMIQGLVLGNSTGAALSKILEKKHPQLWLAICKRLGKMKIDDAHAFFAHAKNYTGCAQERSTIILKKYRKQIQRMRKEIETN